MEKLFSKQGVNPIDVICQQGHVEILSYYLPLYLATRKDSIPITTDESSSITVDFGRAAYIDVPIKRTSTSIHLACERGFINIISFIYNYFKNEAFVPHYLDIDYQDEYTGENCAMIATRCGNYPMMKFLFETCNANFRMKNKRHESMIQIASAGSRKNPQKDYTEVFVYLIETVGCDITYEWEEALLLLEDSTIIKYLEKHLKRKGVDAKKSDLEEKNRIKRANPLTKEETKFEDFGDSHFELGNMIDDRQDRRSLLSSINPSDSRQATPFISVYGDAE